MGCIQSQLSNRNDSDSSASTLWTKEYASYLSMKEQIDIIINYWFLTETDGSNEFPGDIMTLTINKFVYQRAFEFKLNKNSVKYTKQKHFQFKICLIGDDNVGKTCIISEFSNIDIKQQTNCTKNIYIKKQTIELTVSIATDTYDISSRLYGVNGVLICYDITDSQSIKNIKYWNDQCIKYAPYNVQKLVIGNKLDLQNKRVCNEDKIIKIIDQCKILQNDIIEISALHGTGIHIDEPFKMLATMMSHEITKLKTNPFWG
eukprot:226821_1